MQHNLKESCIIHQLGLGYLPMVDSQSEVQSFYANVIDVLGCERIFPFSGLVKELKDSVN